MSQDFWGIVTGREQETVDAENPMILSRFNAKKERAFAITNLAFTPTYRDCIRHLDTKDPWQRKYGELSWPDLKKKPLQQR